MLKKSYMNWKTQIIVLCVITTIMLYGKTQASTPIIDQNKNQPLSSSEQDKNLEQRITDAFLRKDFSNAIDLGKKLAKRQPENPLAHFLLGCAYSTKGRQTSLIDQHRTAYVDLSGWKKVMDWTTDLVKNNPTNAVALTLKGTALDFVGKSTESIKIYKKTISIDPDFPLPYLNLANVYIKSKDYDEAQKILKLLLSRVPECASAYSSLGLIYDQRLNQTDKAQKAYEKALTIDPTHPNILFNYGNLMLRLNKYDKAKKLYLKTIKDHPDFVAVYVNLGAIYFYDGNTKKAIEYFQKATELDPEGEYGKAARDNIRALTD